MKRILLLLTLLIATVGIATAQQRVVKGLVTSSVDGQPVIGATVVVKDSPTIGANTDADGHFSFEVPASAKTLLISFVGMVTKEVAITEGEIKVVLDEDSQMMEAVVVTGYGTTSKKAFTGAASSMGGEKVKAKFDANPVNALKGNVPGMTMSTESGQPGAPTTIFIRGRNSINSGTQPLYVIDGVPIETGSVGMRKREGIQVSPLATLSSDDIASITVLRDATATSIYGARAANGVIVITTKKGAAGFKMNFSARLGTSLLPVNSGSKRNRPVNADTYREMALEGMLNGVNYGKITGLGGKFAANSAKDPSSYPNTEEGRLAFLQDYNGFPNLKPGEAGTDWLKEVTRAGFLQNYGLDISGGGDSPRSPRYYVAFDYLKENGTVVGKDLTRYAMRMNVEQAPFEFFNYGINSSLSLTETNMGAGGGYFSDPLTQAFMQSPFSPVYNPDGTFNFNTVNKYNPVALRSKHGEKSYAKQYRALVSPFATISFFDWLSFTSRAGVDALIADEFGYWSFLQPQGKDMRGMGENGYNTNYYISITNTFNINKSWGDHHLNALLGQEGQRQFSKIAYLAASNYAVEDLVDIVLASTPSEARTSREELKLLSFFSNAEYDFAQRYFLSASMRFDASSRFHKNNRWAPFYSVGAKWRMAEEEFFKPVTDYVQDLTLRTSWGTTGNQEVGSGWYAARGLYGYGSPYNNLPGKIFVQYENPNLKWEHTRKFNVGIDTRLFNMVKLSVDYYNHVTTDMVFGVPLSKASGLPTYIAGVDYYENIGSLQNQGVEFELGIDAIQTEDLSLSFTFTGSANQNKILKLATDNDLNTSITTIRKGHDIYTWYMPEWAGVDPETGRGMWYKNPDNNRDNNRETTFNYREANQVILGKASPDFQGGFRTDLRWKDFDFSLLLSYALGGKIYGDNLRFDEQVGESLGNNYTQWVADNRWRNPGDNALVPMLTDVNTPWRSASSRFLMNGNYLKVQNIMLGYTLKHNSFETIGLSAIRFFLSFDNVYTFVAKDYRGFDPGGIAASGIQRWNYPQSFKFTGGLTLSF